MRRIVFILLMSLAGCTTAIQRGNIIELDQTVFGFNVAASTGTTEMPAVQFGLIRSKVLFVPTSTNKVYSPQFSTSGEINNNGRTLIFGGQDSSFSGECVVVTNQSSTNELKGTNVLLTNSIPTHAAALITIKPPGINNSIISVP